MSLMVCRLRELDGANVPHGLVVARGILLAYHGLFSWSKKAGASKKRASPKIPRGAFPPINTHHKKSTINDGTPPRAARWCLLLARKRSATDRGDQVDAMRAMGCIVSGVGGCMADDVEDNEVSPL